MSPGPGLIDVYWKGSDGGLWVDRYSGGWAARHPWAQEASAATRWSPARGRGLTPSSGETHPATSGPTPELHGLVGRPASDIDCSVGGSLRQRGRHGDRRLLDTAGELWHGALSAGVWSGAVALAIETVAGNPSVVDLAPGAVIVDSREPSG